MRHGKGTIAKDVVVVDEDDGFEAEADTIEELASKEHVTQETETKEAEVTTAKKRRLNSRQWNWRRKILRKNMRLTISLKLWMMNSER